MSRSPVPCSPHEPTLTVLGSARLPVPRERAWELLITPEHIEQWWGHPAVFPTGMHAGAHGTFEWVGHGLMPIHVTRFNPDERLHFYWGELGDPTPGDDASLIEFTLVPRRRQHRRPARGEHGPTPDPRDPRRPGRRLDHRPQGAAGLRRQIGGGRAARDGPLPTPPVAVMGRLRPRSSAAHGAHSVDLLPTTGWDTLDLGTVVSCLPGPVQHEQRTPVPPPPARRPTGRHPVGHVRR